jgi:hypothetical protein
MVPLAMRRLVMAPSNSFANYCRHRFIERLSRHRQMATPTGIWSFGGLPLGSLFMCLRPCDERAGYRVEHGKFSPCFESRKILWTSPCRLANGGCYGEQEKGLIRSRDVSRQGGQRENGINIP